MTTGPCGAALPRFLAVLAAVGLAGALSLRAAAPPPGTPAVPADHAEKMARGRELFTKHVRPLLLDRCVKCHGGEKKRGSLDMVTREGLLHGGDNGPAVVPGKSKESRLFKLAS